MYPCFTIVGTGRPDVTSEIIFFSNTTTGGNPTPYNDVFVCIYLPSGGTSAMNFTLNNNAYYQGNLYAELYRSVQQETQLICIYPANFAPVLSHQAQI
ncbi:MAG: hypothetical protein R3A12_07070 [Ignavibacteria bacterium]